MKRAYITFGNNDNKYRSSNDDHHSLHLTKMMMLMIRIIYDDDDYSVDVLAHLYICNVAGNSLSELARAVYGLHGWQAWNSKSQRSRDEKLG